MADGTLDKPVKPTEDISVREVFGIDSDMKVKGFAEKTDRVPEIDSTYRIDLIGKDAIKLRDGVQVTEFHEGILPWALRNPVAIVFDEYDAGRADVMFVIQRVLEADGKLTLMDQNEIITPHPSFRLFATANTVGLGGPLVACCHAELSEQRRGSRDCFVEVTAL